MASLIERRRVAEVEHYQDALTTERARYDALLAKFHELVHSITDPKQPSYPLQSQPPVFVLGEKSRGALAAMGRGQSGPIRRAMEQKAIQVWHSFAGKDDQDTLTAAAIHRGEPVSV